jgi:hypothetical protein
MGVPISVLADGSHQPLHSLPFKARKLPTCKVLDQKIAGTALHADCSNGFRMLGAVPF